MLRITVETNQGMVANSLLEHPMGTLMYSQADWHRIELSIPHGVDPLEVPGILRLLADDLQRSQQQNESFQAWQESVSEMAESN